MFIFGTLLPKYYFYLANKETQKELPLSVKWYRCYCLVSQIITIITVVTEEAENSKNFPVVISHESVK